MELTYETANMLMLLMPGLLSSSLFNLLRRKQGLTSFDKIIESFLFAFLIYIALNLTYGWEPLAQAKKVGTDVVYTFSADTCLIMLTIVYSVALPLIWGAVVHYDWHMKLFRALKLTDRTSRDTAWDDVFTDEKRFVTVHLKDDRRISGWPLYYSNNKDEGFIYLSQSAWLNDNNEYIDTQSHGVLINREMVELVEFMDDPETEESENEQESQGTIEQGESSPR